MGFGFFQCVQLLLAGRWWRLFCHQNIIGAKFDPPKKKKKKSQTTAHLSRV